MLLRCARGKAIKTLKFAQITVFSRAFTQSIKQSVELSHTIKRGVRLAGHKPVLMNQLPNQTITPPAMVAPRAATSAVSCLLTKAANSLITDHSILQSIDQWPRFDILIMTHNDRKHLFNHYSATCLRHAHAYLQQQRKQSKSQSDSLSEGVVISTAEPVTSQSNNDTSVAETDDQKPTQKSKAQLKRERKALERTGAITVAETEEQKLAQEWSVMIAKRASELFESFRSNSSSQSATQSTDSELEPLLQYNVTFHANEMNETKRGGGVIDINIRPRERSAETSTAASMEFDHQTIVSNPSLPPSISFTPIGYLDSCYKLRYGTPRQGSITPNSKARLTLLPHVSHHSLIGLEEYSHVWLVFVFHDNENKQINPKVEPPRLGSKVGLFATRTPHRYNPVGLSLVRLDRVEWKSRLIEVSGIDLLHGTPILDIKPYHPSDSPLPPASLPSWLHEKPSNPLTVEFTDAANEQMTELLSKMEFYTDLNQAKCAIVDSISFDPRPLYVKARREAEAVYGFRFDSLNVSYSVDDDKETATICCVEYVTVDAADTKDLINPVSQLLDEKQRTRAWLETVGRSNRFSFIEQKRAEKKQKIEHSAQEPAEAESSNTI